MNGEMLDGFRDMRKRIVCGMGIASNCPLSVVESLEDHPIKSKRAFPKAFHTT